MFDFTVVLQPKILIGNNNINRLASLTTDIGNRALLVTEQAFYDNNQVGRILNILEEAGVQTLVFDEVPAQATADTAEIVAELASGARCDVIIGYGGIKTQAISRLACILATRQDYLFDLLDGDTSYTKAIPYIAVLTSGRESFMFSDAFVVVDPRDRGIRYIKSPGSQAQAIIIDTALIETLSEKFAATTIFDGLLLAVESYCSARSNFLSDAILERAFTLYGDSLREFSNKHNISLLEKSAQAGFLSSLGSALSSPGIGTALSYAINGKYNVAKSWSSTVLLPYIMEHLLTAVPEKLARIASLLGEAVEGAGLSDQAALSVEAIRRWIGLLAVPARLKDFGLKIDTLTGLVENAKSMGFVSFSPRPVSSDDVFNFLKQAY